MSGDKLIIEVVHPKAVQEIRMLAKRLDVTVDEAVVFLLGMAMQQAQMMGLIDTSSRLLDPKQLNEEERKLFRRMIALMRPLN